MIAIRKSQERGLTKTSWLNSRHTFSFADYHDPKFMGFRSLRVINEDQIGPGGGFPTHHHSDMEILTYLVSGGLEHKDSLGNGSVIRPGEIQRMTAGTGIAHSEFNHSRAEPAHLLQIWLLPAQSGLTPGYEQRSFNPLPGALLPLAGPNAPATGVTIHQDATLAVGLLQPNQTLELGLRAGRFGWLQVVRGALRLGELQLKAGDGAALDSQETALLRASAATELLWFDLA
ncbi:MAG TPA: pirin family protein [Candidatus Binataceae bacterium]|nr:pirin family protein [Candidatus Binataceae bacterium]